MLLLESGENYPLSYACLVPGRVANHCEHKDNAAELRADLGRYLTSRCRRVNYSDPFGSSPNCRGYEGSPRYIDEEVKFQQSLTPRDRVVLGGVAVGAAAVGIGVMAATTSMMTSAAIAAASHPASIAILAGASKLASSNLGQQIQAAGRMVGSMRLGQSAAVDVLGKTITRLGAEFGRTTIGDVQYLYAARATQGVVNAIGVNANGSTFSTTLRLGAKGLELMK
jgi:hypothetical protein